MKNNDKIALAEAVSRLHDEAAYARATARARALQERARLEYPLADGYFHDERSNGWPDPCCDLAVYRRVPDRRHRDGYRLDLVTILR